MTKTKRTLDNETQIRAQRFLRQHYSRKDSLLAHLGGRFPKRHNPNLGGVVEARTDSLFDQVSFGQGVAFAQTVLFQVPISGTKTKAQTNMTQAGILPNPYRFTIYALGVHISNNTIPADMQNLLANVSFVLHVNTKPYQVGPLAKFPAGRGWQMVAAAAVGQTPSSGGQIVIYSTSNGSVSMDQAFTFDIPITIEQGEPFDVTLNPETAFSLTANTTNPPGVGTVITVYLDGNIEVGVS